MNDVPRNTFSASNTNTLERLRQIRTEDHHAYQTNIPALAVRLMRESPAAKRYYMTLTPFDELSDCGDPMKGGGDELSRYAETVRSAQAVDPGSVLVELGRPMNRFIEQIHVVDPTCRYIVDRVHPAQFGHLVMASLFLKSQGVDGRVSDVAVDALSGKTLRAEKASVSDIVGGPDSLAFSVKAEVPPWAIDERARGVLLWTDIEKELNRETLAVKGLASGHWTLRIDAVPVGTYSSADLAGGVELGFNRRTPQYREAEEVFRCCERLWLNPRCLRNRNSMIYHRKSFFSIPYGTRNRHSAPFPPLIHWVFS